MSNDRTRLGLMVLAIGGMTAMGAATPAQAAVEWNDTFTDGSRTDGASPTDGA